MRCEVLVPFESLGNYLTHTIHREIHIYSCLHYRRKNRAHVSDKSILLLILKRHRGGNTKGTNNFEDPVC